MEGTNDQGRKEDGAKEEGVVECLLLAEVARGEFNDGMHREPTSGVRPANGRAAKNHVEYHEFRKGRPEDCVGLAITTARCTRLRRNDEMKHVA